MKKVVIVNCFDTYEDRVDLLHDFFNSKGHCVSVIQSDFRHFKKVHRSENKTDYIFIKSKPYYKNLSIPRLISHYDFAKKAFKMVDKIAPDLLYVLIPPNSLGKFAAKYKRKNDKVKLVFDLIDLWPETMPMGNIKNVPPFTFWKLMRDKSLRLADIVITECNLYQDVLKKVLKGIKAETLYLAKRQLKVKSSKILSEDRIDLCYLGSINNIIDIPKVKAIVNSINKIKPTTLHIIGDGESKENFINEIKDTGSNVKYYGKVYDAQKKQDIFDICHFGLNIMKDSVCVGLTMKSIDYFQHGVPIINNIKADTTQIVNKRKAGINLGNLEVSEVCNRVISMNLVELVEMGENAYKSFEEMFSQKAFNHKMEQIVCSYNLVC